MHERRSFDAVDGTVAQPVFAICFSAMCNNARGRRSSTYNVA
jgi:hypothetical protein